MSFSARSIVAPLIFLVLLFPTLLFAATVSGLVVCGNVAGEECTFNDLVTQVQTALNFLIFKVAAPLATVMFAYAGFLYVTNAGNEGKIKEAHEIFWNVLIGFIIVLAAWLTINFILVFFLGAASPFNFLTQTPVSNGLAVVL